MYTLSRFPNDERLAKERDGTIVMAVDVPAEGNMTFQYNDGGTHMVLSPSSRDVLAAFNDKIPEDIFHRDLAAICRAKFIRPDTQTIERITLTRLPIDAGIPEETILQWDACRCFPDFPGKLLQMIIDFGDLLKHFICETETNSQ
jgi:hypothetical protein